ncbi:NAD(P)-dependent oxidoreductase [Rhodobacteraceae bacterium]|nr:NAD(P)-dependent oxidoreductase [Paracoccaceae bacterium]
MPVATHLGAKAPVRCLVTGGTGRLGPLLARAWALGPAGLEPVFQARREGQGGSVIFDPLTQPDAFEAEARTSDVILHLAGPTAGTPQTLSCNRDLAQAAHAAARAAGRPVIIASSAAVYGAPDQGQVFHEDDMPRPQSPYGAAKYEMEQAVAGQSGVCCVRIGNVLGADALLGRAAPEGGRVVDVFADGSGPRRSFIGPQALARALARLARLAAYGAQVPAVINLALPDVVAMDDILRAAGEPFSTRPAPDGAIGCVAMDVGRAVALGLVGETPARAQTLVADLMELRTIEERAR